MLEKELIVPLPNNFKIGIFKEENNSSIYFYLENPNGFVISDVRLLPNEVKALKAILDKAVEERTELK